MAKKERIWIVIAAYNEEGVIGRVVKSLKKGGYKNVIVVDDGSKDNTFDQARKAGALTLNHVVNRGQGASLQTGIVCALDEEADYIVTFDGDGQHQVKDIKKLLKPVRSGKYDVALGSRFLEGAGEIPPARKFLLKGSVIVQRIFYGVDLTDAHNGFRVLSRKAAEKIDITSDRMEHASQIAEEIFKHDLKVKEIPVDIIYDDDIMKKGHGSFFQAVKVFLRFLWRKFVQ